MSPCPRTGKGRWARVFRLGGRTSHASVRVLLQEVHEDLRRQGDLRRARQAPPGELLSLRQHRCGAGHDACRGEDLEEVLTVFVPAHSLYPICQRNPFRQAMSSSPSTPLGEDPSTTPRIPRPWLVSATMTSVGLAVAQKSRQSFSTTHLLHPSALSLDEDPGWGWQARQGNA